MSSENNVHLKGTFQHEEYRAADDIEPAMLIELNSDGEVIPHSTEGGRAELLFAEINVLNGEDMEDDYEDDDLVMCNLELAGNRVQLILTAGEDVDIGDMLISAGDGQVIENGNEDSSTTVVQIIATALEALDLSASGAVDGLIEARLMPGA